MSSVSPAVAGRTAPTASTKWTVSRTSGWEPEKKCPRLRAVDRTITVLEVKRGTGNRTIGVLAFLAAHPTVLHHEAPIFSSDFTGWAVGSIEREWAGGPAPVVAFFNGAEGDITARRVRRDLRDVRGNGEILATSIRALLEPGVPGEPATEAFAVADAETSTACVSRCARIRPSLPGWI